MVAVKNKVQKQILLIAGIGLTWFFSGCNSSNPDNKLYINEVMSKNVNSIVDDKSSYSDWIEIFNSSEEEINLAGYYLSDSKKDKKWFIPNGTTISSNSYVVFWADGKNRGYHTNFKLVNKNEKIHLFSPAGDIIDKLELPEQFNDISYGRSPISNEQLGYFFTPTPGQKNADNPINVFERMDEPQFSLKGGLYTEIQNIKIEANCKDCTIRYTLDCSIPNDSSQIYSGQLQIDSTCVIRARTFSENRIPSKIVTHTFIIREPTDLPVFSIVTKPKNIWDDYIGIYAKGKNGKKGEIGPVANWNQDWERRANIEYFDENNNLAFNEYVGIRILGQFISAFPQKPIGIYFKEKYGVEKIKYKFFKDKEIDEFTHIVLRVADWGKTNIRDAVMGALVAGGKADMDYQGYSPAIVYLNGAYWGVYNLREKQNEHYLAGNYGVSPDSVDIIENALGKTILNEGSMDEYNNLMNFVQSNSLADAANYKAIGKKIDTVNFLDYHIAQIYFANSDWPGNNLKCWRPKTKDGKWRWMLYDSDVGFDNYNRQYYKHNTLAWALSAKGDLVHNPPHSTLLFRKMFENASFRRDFLQKMCVHLNSTFEEKRVIHIIDSIHDMVAKDMPRQVKKWGDMKMYNIAHSYKTMSDWEKNVEVMRIFARKRPDNLFNMFQHIFGLSKPVPVYVQTEGEGEILMENVNVGKNYYGLHFEKVVLKLKPKPKPGYRFVKWTGGVETTKKEIGIVIQKEARLTAVFEKIPT